MTNSPQATGEFPARVKAVLKLALPIVAGMGSQNLMNLIDIAMVGRLGTAPLAAVGIANIAIWVMTSPLQGIAPAVQAITARRLGEGQRHRLHESIVNAFFLIFAFAIPYSVFLALSSDWMFNLLSGDPAVRQAGTGYMQIRLVTVALIGLNLCFRGYFNGLKKPLLYMQTLLLMHPINILLNFLLIFGHLGLPPMGVEGAALGSAIATAFGTANFLRLMLKHKNPGFSFSPKVVTAALQRNILKLAIPSCLQNLMLAMGFLAFFRIAAMIGTEALAATNVLVNLALVCILFSMGMGLATITLVGSALGEGNPLEARLWVRGALTITCAWLGIVGGLFALFPSMWLHLFIVNPDVVAMARLPTILMGLSQVYDGAGIVLMHAHLGGGANKAAMIISVVNQWVIFLPACFAWVYFFDGGLLEIWISMVAYRFLLFISFGVSIRRGSWLKQNF